jgi:class 3 adenylate cyclase
MSGPSDTRYVAVDDADVAYQVAGDGPVDLLFCYGLGSHIEFNRQVRTVAEFQDRLASFSRLITFDRRGMGASDGVPRNAVPTWEEWAEDVAAVMEATQSARPTIFASIDSGPMAMLFTAMHPERVDRLVLLNCVARSFVADDYPIGVTREVGAELVELIATSWGTPEFVALANPSADAEFIALTAPVLRASATPRTAAALMDNLLATDVREVLPLIRVPTLVLQGTAQPLVPVEYGSYIADHIEGAVFVLLPGGDASFTQANLVIADEIAEFLTGERPSFEVERVLTTVLFTDIVDSTQRAAAMGDRKWRVLLDTHDRIVRDELRRYGGREINTTGDGFLASFDGPARALRCARAIVDAASLAAIDVRVGVHTGECEVRGDDLGGIAVHIGARVASEAQGGQVLTTSTVRELVAGSGITFADHGVHELKGIADTWHLYEAMPSTATEAP